MNRRHRPREIRDHLHGRYCHRCHRHGNDRDGRSDERRGCHLGCGPWGKRHRRGRCRGVLPVPCVAVVCYPGNYPHTNSNAACATSVQVTLSFGGKAWPINPEDINLGPLERGSSMCLGAIFDLALGTDLGEGGPGWVVGDTFLASLASYDYDSIFSFYYPPRKMCIRCSARVRCRSDSHSSPQVWLVEAVARPCLLRPSRGCLPSPRSRPSPALHGLQAALRNRRASRHLDVRFPVPSRN